jgi:hypothetical protein
MGEVTREDQPRILFKGKPANVIDIARTSGYKQSAVWCHTVEELIGVIGGGEIGAISREHALLVAEEMVKQGYAERVTGDGIFLGWNIHSKDKIEEDAHKDNDHE